MALKDIIGHEQPLKILRGHIKRNHIAHAYLFTGEEGIGKRLTAINFAKTLNCLKNQGTEIDCCDECLSCIKIDKLSHPDVFIIESTDGQIRVDIIRNLEESLSYKAFEGRWKIAIIDDAETLNQSAANAFLKTLEEPPTKTILILISSMPELIPETILSRCQRIKFTPIPLDRMKELLQDKDQRDFKKIMTLTMLSGGRPGWCLRKDLIQRRDRVFREFKRLITSAEDDSWEGKESMEEWFEWVHLWLRDIAVLKATGDVELLINQDMRKELEVISKNAELNAILKLSEAFYRIKEFLRFNLNKRITLLHTHLLLKKTLGRIDA
jgi:DNA polymerase-3 subunit delta'